MATAASTLVIKTEGVTESYKDIGNLLGPLQGINTMLYQLNKALGIVNKQSVSNGKSLTSLAKEGNATAKSQLDLQKQLRATAKEATKAAKEQTEHAKSAADSLKKVNLMQGLSMAASAGKALLDVTKKIGEAAFSCVEAYLEQGGATSKTKEHIEAIKSAFTAVKVLVGKIISQKLDSAMENVKDPVRLVGDLFRGAAKAVIRIKEGLTITKEVVKGLGGVVVAALWTPIKGVSELIAKVMEAGSQLPWLESATQQSMANTAQMLRDFGSMQDNDFTETVDNIKKAHEEASAACEQIDQQFNNKVIAQTMARVKKNADTEIKTAKETAEKKQEIERETEGNSAETLHQQRMAAIQTEYSAKLAALDELQGDTQLKAQLEDQLRLEYLEKEKQERLSYAQQTNDQRAIINQQYRDAEQAAADAAFEREKQKADEVTQKIADQEQKWKDLAKSLKEELEQGALSAIGTSITDIFDSAVEGEEMTREGAYEMFRSLAKNIYQVGIQSLLKTVGELIMNAGNSAAQTPIVGPIVAAAAMATMGGITAGLMAKYKPKKASVSYANGGYISAGMVKGGVYGKDSVAASLMPGERVLSKKEAEEYDNSTAKGLTQSITINITGQFDSTESIRAVVRNRIIPELQAASRQGYAF